MFGGCSSITILLPSFDFSKKINEFVTNKIIKLNNKYINKNHFFINSFTKNSIIYNIIAFFFYFFIPKKF